jgi:lysophospholipase L1-like esterase
VVGLVADRLDAAVRIASAESGAVLVSTLLPNLRDPADLRDGVNAEIQARHPDALRLGERFTEAGWQSLLGDEIHPNAQGYAVLAGIVADELARRGLPGK